MAKNFKALFNKLPPHVQKSVKKGTRRILRKLPLRELRVASGLSQKELADRLFTKQSNISRLEYQTDMYISTLRCYIEALGGTLDIVARFPKGDIHMGSFKRA